MGNSEQEYLEKICNTNFSSSKEVTENLNVWQITEIEN